MKTELDRKIDRMLDAYYERFGKQYPLGYDHRVTTEKMFEEIEEALKTGKPVEVDPLVEDALY